MFDVSTLHWPAIGAMVVFSFVLGGVWYGPLFGRAWLASLGKKETELGGPALPMLLSVVTGLVCAVVTFLFVDSIGARTLIDGAIVGALAAIGFVAMSTASDMAFCRHSPKLWLIQSGYRLVLLTVMAAVFAVWR